jgi:hypothetical protein
MAPKCSKVLEPAGTGAAGEDDAAGDAGKAPGSRVSDVMGAPHSAQKLALWESDWPHCAQRRSLILPLFPIVTA